MPRRRTIPALVMVSATLLLGGCAGTVAVPAAPQANAPECAEVMVRLPDSVAGAERRWTDSQSTAAWGDPTTVIFSCGVPSPGPTTLRCESVAGVDWVIDESEAPRFRVTTFGREPAVELFFDTEITEDVQGVSSRDVLESLSPVVARLPRTGAACVDRAEATPVPTPVTP
ncbi:DUF3515 family protein [Microbacterium imperiale]|uniref:DUF3515 domain-containing protein n=1 Tax=Microbacterium imperiale TaxID=33884 RepID=A0A9W6HFW2_9MICO|nr:DUF3515 family protein [Microbacterium imperiale]MBP2419611.1 hypothetical protein [Microbacterium imperiale]MDS0198523.1 DUF3515 domain-containing protein [Microbacterium imperiale]BFE39952.1 hypothetical protein GCM10017544_09080 [Microbacterium imperiale]GLJ79073.1 hypothetical protein GCM10017586_07550 [Microbacterium imperiale]